ncbi:hypothetical protein AcW1_008888 [Taiwanofungus camphoratus]|nr:hypothetical protein AcW1_008888 [Antrodia cinnamomea]
MTSVPINFPRQRNEYIQVNPCQILVVPAGILHDNEFYHFATTRDTFEIDIKLSGPSARFTTLPVLPTYSQRNTGNFFAMTVYSFRSFAERIIFGQG